MSEPEQIALIDVGPRKRRRRPVLSFALPASPAAMRRPGYLVWRALKAFGPLMLLQDKKNPRVESLERAMKLEHDMDAHAVARALKVATDAGYVTQARDARYVAHDTAVRA